MFTVRHVYPYTNRTPDSVHDSYDTGVSLVKFTVQVYDIIQTFKSVRHYLVLLLLLCRIKYIVLLLERLDLSLYLKIDSNN